MKTFLQTGHVNAALFPGNESPLCLDARGASEGAPL